MALTRAFTENWNAFIATIAEVAPSAESPGNVVEADILRKMENALECLKSAKEILNWIYPRGTSLSFEKGMRIAAQMREAGFPGEWAEDVVKGIGRKKAGRPATKRQIAILAKEMRLRDPKRWKWRMITAELCDCGSATHTVACQDNLRREILHLEKVLSKFGCALDLGKTR